MSYTNNDYPQLECRRKHNNLSGFALKNILLLTNEGEIEGNAPIRDCVKKDYASFSASSDHDR